MWFPRPQDVPKIVELKFCHMGITGLDWVVDHGREKVKKILNLPYGRPGTDGKTKIVLFCAKGDKSKHSSIQEVVSEYPHLAREFFQREYGYNVIVHFSHGTSEVLIPEMYQWGICLTETGASLAENGLKIARVILRSHTVMISSKRTNPEEEKIIRQLKATFTRTIRNWPQGGTSPSKRAGRETRASPLYCS